MKRLIKKSEQEFICKFKSPIIVNIGDENSWRATTHLLSEVEEYSNIINDAINDSISEMGSGGLAEYLDMKHDAEIYDIITGIFVNVENNQAITTVKSTEELTENDKELVKQYITRQFSDGWGEGFEQNELDSWKETDEYEEWDEEEEESYTEEYEYEATMSASLWYNKNWSITEV